MAEDLTDLEHIDKLAELEELNTCGFGYVVDGEGVVCETCSIKKECPFDIYDAVNKQIGETLKNAIRKKNK